MSTSTTLGYAPGAGDGRIGHLAARLGQALGAARERWRQAAEVRARHAAVRGLDRRTRQDLGLYADDEPWQRDGPLTTEYERLRW